MSKGEVNQGEKSVFGMPVSCSFLELAGFFPSHHPSPAAGQGFDIMTSLRSSFTK